ncbi:hypothetical protein DSCA_06760 [Desulfosarcina alkanivorans]|uniref:Uncharacterized protein n=1 Tax=Desulfosarcina alkanivorans TaxID=571177 RepID=A0A5K7YCS8_9BACT|nr:hypothetical protein [Desulfosarcina alkanivorans]BBO66746.1 hypothetical protein DSCA_06760 [Desulfosarcina alkanivorans]
MLMHTADVFVSKDEHERRSEWCRDWLEEMLSTAPIRQSDRPPCVANKKTVAVLPGITRSLGRETGQPATEERKGCSQPYPAAGG